MSGKIKRVDPKKAGYETWYSIRCSESLSYWVLGTGWSSKLFRDAGLSLLAISMKSSVQLGTGNTRNFTKRNCLRLECGVVVESGNECSKPQEQTMAITNLRVDSVQQANKALTELSKIYGFKTWTTQAMEIYNKNKGITLYFLRFNPDGTGIELYLDAMETADWYKYYYDINPFVQQSACEHIQEKIASCEKFTREVTTTKCALQKHLEEKNAKV